MRLDKFLALSNIGRRKDVRIYIKEGKVTVNNKVVFEPAIEIDEFNDIIEYINNVVTYTGKVYYMFNKPMGCITARRDKSLKTVFDYLTELKTEGVFHVGRLDKDTEGLLLLTNDGEFEHKLMSPENHVDKTYYFWALGSLEEEKQKKLEKGIKIAKGKIETKPAKIKIDKFGSYRDYKNEISVDGLESFNTNRYDQQVVSGYLTISEGCKHQVKRMLKEVGCQVVYLKRISIGGLLLDKNLKRGKYRVLNKSEIQSLFEV